MFFQSAFHKIAMNGSNTVQLLPFNTLILYSKNLIFLSLIMEVCNILLKKSNTESKLKQTNATQ